MDDKAERRQARQARFARDAAKPPPPPPKRTFAHPGGKMTSNKDEAMRKYLARKGDSLNAAQQAALTGMQQNGLAPPTPPKDDRTDKLYIGNLPFSVDGEKLGAMFSGRFEVIGAKIVCDRTTNRGRGFGFVTFGSAADAATAHDAFQGTRLEGRVLTVKYATQRGQKAQAPVLRKDGWGSWASPSTAAAPVEAPAAPAPAAVPAPEADLASKPLEEQAPVEAVALWKIATAAEVAAWRTAGVLLGSEMDARDGFVHCATAEQARVVAALYFAGQGGLKLLRVGVETLPKDTLWTVDDDAALRGRAGVAVRRVPAEAIAAFRGGTDVLHDGCLHLHARPSLAWSSVDEFDLPLVDGAHAFPRECVETEGPRGQTMGSFSITY